MINKEFLELLDKMKTTHISKAKDYSSSGPDENFERSALVSNWFDNALDKVFVVMITTKLARLATLLNKSAKPNNESIDDSFLDLAVYCSLWYANYKRRKDNE